MLMRHRFIVVLTFVTLGASLVLAQPATPPDAPPSAPPDNDPVLNQLLAQWERDMGSMQSLVVEFNCTRTYASTRTKDEPEGIKKHFVGALRCLRLADGNYGASVTLSRADNPRVIVEQYICTGTHIYNISPEAKTIDVIKLPERKAGQPLDDGPLPFLTGMRADVARRRYQLVAKEPAAQDLKPWYTYLEVRPNFDRDRQDFDAARVVIMKRDNPNPPIPAGMPRELFWVEPNKNTTKWDIVRVARNVKDSVRPTEFMPPNVGKDWKIQNVTTSTAPSAPPGQPRVIRNQDR